MLFLHDYSALSPQLRASARRCAVRQLLQNRVRDAGPPIMREATYRWLFVRGDDALTLERITPECLTVSSCTGDRHFHDFGSSVHLLEFQLAFHDHLISTGWVLEDFSPERRVVDTDVDRRDVDRRVLPSQVPPRAQP
jgi:hypothetical protein